MHVSKLRAEGGIERGLLASPNHRTGDAVGRESQPMRPPHRLRAWSRWRGILGNATQRTNRLEFQHRLWGCGSARGRVRTGLRARGTKTAPVGAGIPFQKLMTKTPLWSVWTGSLSTQTSSVATSIPTCAAKVGDHSASHECSSWVQSSRRESNVRRHRVLSVPPRCPRADSIC